VKFETFPPEVRVRPELGLFLALLEAQRQDGCVDLQLARVLRELTSEKAA
jgi:hypothetical protein